MNWKLIVAALAVLALAGADAALAAKKKARRAPPPAAGPPTNSSMAPARMIEIRPGYWISSYGCVTDEGNGRVMPCGAGGDVSR